MKWSDSGLAGRLIHLKATGSLPGVRWWVRAVAIGLILVTSFPLVSTPLGSLRATGLGVLAAIEVLGPREGAVAIAVGVGLVLAGGQAWAGSWAIGTWAEGLRLLGLCLAAPLAAAPPVVTRGLGLLLCGVALGGTYRAGWTLPWVWAVVAAGVVAAGVLALRHRSAIRSLPSFLGRLAPAYALAGLGHLLSGRLADMRLAQLPPPVLLDPVALEWADLVALPLAVDLVAVVLLCRVLADLERQGVITPP